jgi:hypothetical protein
MNIILYSACIPGTLLHLDNPDECVKLLLSLFSARRQYIHGIDHHTIVWSPQPYVNLSQSPTGEVSLLVIISSKTALRVSIISGGVKSKDIDKELEFSFAGIRVENCGLTPITALPAPPPTTKLPWPGPFLRPPPLEALPASPPMNRLRLRL